MSSIRPVVDDTQRFIVSAGMMIAWTAERLGIVGVIIKIVGKSLGAGRRGRPFRARRRFVGRESSVGPPVRIPGG